MYVILIKEEGKQRSKFLTSNGGMNNLRIHAAQIQSIERAQEICNEINEENKGKFTAKPKLIK